MRRPTAPREMPPPLEVECLKALWALGEGTVRGVRDAMPERKLAYTIVMTLLDRLEKRGTVIRVKRGRSFLYTAKATPEEMRELAVKELLERFFDGSKHRLTDFLLTSTTPQSPPQSPAKRSPQD